MFSNKVSIKVDKLKLLETWNLILQLLICRQKQYNSFYETFRVLENK